MAFGLGCSSNNTGGSSLTGPIGEKKLSVPSAGVFGVVADKQGAPLDGVTVTIQGTNAKSGVSGIYKVTVSGATDDMVAYFQKDGYVDVYRKVSTFSKNGTRLDVIMAKVGSEKTLDDAAAGGSVQGAGLAVSIPAGAFVDSNGAAVNGEVKLNLTYFNPTSAADLDACPGELIGRDDSGKVTALKTLGMIDLTALKDGKKLQIADGQKVSVEIPVPSGMLTPPATVPLWSFDKDAGQWVQEGNATLDVAKNVYVANLPHLSPWNIDQVENVTCVKGRVVDAANGDAVVGGIVRFSGPDISMFDQKFTDDNGNFCLFVPIDTDINVSAIHPSGGGTVKSVHTQITPVMVNYKQCDKCQDIGTIVVEAGMMHEGTHSEACADVMSDFYGTCLDGLSDYASCFQTSGKCKGKGGMTEMSVTWENGAKIVSSVKKDSDGKMTSTTKSYSSSGKLCGTIVTVSDTEDATTYTSVVTDYHGNKWTMMTDDNAKTTTIKCENNETVTLTNDQLTKWDMCMGAGGLEQECDWGNNGTGYSMCSSDSDCNGYKCCIFGNGQGVCLTECPPTD